MTLFPRSHGEHAYGQNHIEGDFRRTPLLQVARDPTLEKSTQAKLCGGIWPGLKTFLQLHHGGHPQSLRDI